jgi:hypothetical protein
LISSAKLAIILIRGGQENERKFDCNGKRFGITKVGTDEHLGSVSLREQAGSLGQMCQVLERIPAPYDFRS